MRAWQRLREDLELPTLIRAINERLVSPVVSKTAAYSATVRDQLIKADATGGAFTVTLPTAVGATSKTYTIKRMNAGANAVTVACSGAETIDGSATYSLSSQYASVTVVSDNSNWLVI